jgi:hypothetical protein
MKKSALLVVFISLVLAGCSDQMIIEEMAVSPVVSQVDSANFYLEKARWGDGEAYLKLAHFYHDGKGLKRDFVSMLCMAAMAQQYDAIGSLDEFMHTLPVESDYKMAFDALIRIYEKKYDESCAMSERLINMGCAEGYAIKGILFLECGDTVEMKRNFELAAERGSSCGELLLCMKDWKNNIVLDMGKLLDLSPRIPLANVIIAAQYTEMVKDGKNYDYMASCFYLEADKSAFLGKKNAKWLVNYYRNGGRRLISDQDYKRIKILAGENE